MRVHRGRVDENLRVRAAGLGERLEDAAADALRSLGNRTILPLKFRNGATVLFLTIAPTHTRSAQRMSGMPGMPARIACEKAAD